MSIQYRSINDYLAAVKRRFYVDPALFSNSELIYSEKDRIDDINTAREEIASDLLCSATRSSFVTIAGTQVYDLTAMNSKLIQVDNVYYGTTGLTRNIIRKDDQWGRSLADNATPEYYYVDEAQHYIHLMPPPPVAATVYVYNYQIPSKLTGVATTETVIPIQHRHIPELYALWRGYERVPGAASKTMYYMKRYETELAQAKGKVKNGQLRGARKRIRFLGYGIRNTSDWK